MDNLPEELLSKTFQGLSNEHLGALTVVNKKFSRIATPLLYSSCQLVSTKPRLQLRRVRRMLSTVIARHDLRALVREVRTGDWRTTADYERERNDKAATMSAYEMAAIIQCIPFLASYSHEKQRDWVEGLLHASPDAITMAMLSMLPNLKSLTIDRDVEKGYNNEMESDYYWAGDKCTVPTNVITHFTTCPGNAFPLFKNLSYLCIDGKLTGNLYESGWEVDTILVYLRLPALRTFIGRGCADMKDYYCEGEDRLKDEGAFSNVTDITLADCTIHTEDIRNVLRSCHALESFKCSRVCKPHFGQDPIPNYSYAGLHNDLYRHRESLRSLQLDAKSCRHNTTLVVKPIETLAFLKTLEFLQLDEDVLIGNTWPIIHHFGDVLPPQVQRVVIKGGACPLSQGRLFEEIGRALLSGEVHATFEMQRACITVAEHALQNVPSIELHEITDRYEVDSALICSFLIYRRDDGTSED